MCFGINKYGQMVDLGLTGQYDYRLNQYQQNMPALFPSKTYSQPQSYKQVFQNNSFNSLGMSYWDTISKLLEQIKNPNIDDVLLPSQKSGWGGIYERYTNNT